ncbi:MAG: DDE-type integrase/transposase/recombinase [Candidatus Anstonellaceae archaeon]
MGNITCPRCKGMSIKKDGIRKTQNRGKIQRYKCKNCSYRFSIDDGFWKMKNHENKITSCINMYYAGMSLRKIQEHLQMFAPKNCHYSTIYRWIVKYANMISNFTDKLQINSGKELMSDEMEYHRLGKQNWFVDVMDTETRFMVASDYMESRTIENLIRVLRKAKLTTNGNVKIITTDGLQGYPRVLRKVFGLNRIEGKSKIIHNVVIADERGFIHKIERLHNTIRDRTKIMRGFHGSLESAKAIMKGFEIYYNFIRKHQGIGKTPAEEGMPELILSTNKWLSLIRLSKTKKI